MDDDFGVSRGLENMAVLFVLPAEQRGVDQVAVVGDGDRADEIFPKQRLGVAQFAGAGRGIADVADGGVAGEFFLKHARREDLADQAHAGVAVEACRRWTAMPADSWPRCCWAKRPLIDDRRSVGRAPDAE